MQDHRIGPRDGREEELLKRPVDAHQVNQVRGLILAALDEGNTMIEQMGAAPGAKWGDMVAAIFTASGDLSMIAPHGVVGFAACCHYPIKFILKHWAPESTTTPISR
jgi:hypothetical protein